MSASVESAAAHAGLLTDGGLHRINRIVAPKQFSLDGSKGIDDLVALGYADGHLKEHLDVVEARFLNGNHVAPFTPVTGTP